MTRFLVSRRILFSLKTLFVLVALIGLGLGWITNSLRWIRERHEMLAGQPLLPPGKIPPPFGRVRAPGLLWLFGEEGVAVVCWYPGSPVSLQVAQRLFPEGEIIEYQLSDHEGPPPTPGLSN